MSCRVTKLHAEVILSQNLSSSTRNQTKKKKNTNVSGQGTGKALKSNILGY